VERTIKSGVDVQIAGAPADGQVQLGEFCEITCSVGGNLGGKTSFVCARVDAGDVGGGGGDFALWNGMLTKAVQEQPGEGAAGEGGLHTHAVELACVEEGIYSIWALVTIRNLVFVSENKINIAAVQ
jgi:hypothetical protein